MECSHIRRKLSEYLDNELEGAENLAVSEHIRNCAQCERDYKELSLLLTALTEVPYAEPPEYLRKEIIAATCGVPEPATRWLERAGVGLLGNRELSWGAAVALVLLGALVMHQDPPSHPKITQTRTHPAQTLQHEGVPKRVCDAPSPVVNEQGAAVVRLRPSEPAAAASKGRRSFVRAADVVRIVSGQKPKPVIVATSAVHHDVYVARPEMQPVEPVPEVVENENPPIEPIETAPVEEVPEPQPPVVEPKVANSAVRDAIRREDIDNYIKTLNRRTSRVRYDENRITYKVVSKKF